MQDVIFLKKNPVFSQVKTEELREVAAIAREREYASGEKVVTEGEPGDSLFLVKSGSVRITKLVGKEEVTLATLPQASIFGEMVLFEDAPRSANAYAAENSLLMILQKSELIHVIKLYPDIAIQLFKVMGARLRSANDKVRELSEQLEKKV